MKLLLFLSALLSAFAGVGGGSRAAQAMVVAGQAAEAAPTVRATRATPAGRPAQTYHPVAGHSATAAFALAPVVPLYLSRRRE